MSDTTIRIYFQKSDGTLEDGKQDYGIEDFGGVIPTAGDLILVPGVNSSLDRQLPQNRRFWSVVRRVFNPRDNGGKYVALIVQTRTIERTEEELLP